MFRASADVGLHTQSTDLLGGNSSTGLGWTFDLGIKVSDEVEIEAQLPVSQLFVSTPFGTSDQGTIGNLSLGANWFGKKESLLFKVGGAVAFGPWNDDATALETAALATALAMRGTEDIQLWAPGYLTLSVPTRIALGDVIRFTGDGQLTFMAPTAGGDAETALLLAPGLSLALAQTI